MRPVPAAARRTALAAGVALLAAGGWWLLRAPAIERPAAAVPPPPDIETPAGRARIDAAIALATLPDDPWTFAESLAASAPDAADPREKEDCGMAEGPQFSKTDSTDEEPVLVRAASSRYLAAQARIDAALRASPDPLDRATADFVNAGDVRTSDGVVAAVAQQAAVATDPRVYVLGFELCRKASPAPPACAALTAERWAQVDAGNGMPWVQLLDEAQSRGDEAATRDAMAHLAASTRFDMYLDAPAGAVARHVPADGRDLVAAGDLLTRAIMQDVALPMPPLLRLFELCRRQAGGDEQRAQQCRAISDTMYSRTDSFIPLAMSGGLLFQTTGDASRRELVKAEGTVLAAHWSPGTGLAPCHDLRERMRQAARKADVGEVQAMREEARRFVPP